MVALRKESVDRNGSLGVLTVSGNESLSARRAWIEIAAATPTPTAIIVALRKESVDRNTQSPLKDNTTDRSLSARRAWIEMPYIPLAKVRHCGRSPQGERG